MNLDRMLRDPFMAGLFHDHFPIPGLKRRRMLAQPASGNDVLMERAFKYLAGFNLERSFQKSMRLEWPARGAWDVMKLRSGKYSMSKHGQVRPRTKEPAYCPSCRDDSYSGKHDRTGWESAVFMAGHMINTASIERQNFLSTGAVTNSLFESAIGLAVVELAAEIGIPDGLEPACGDVLDLKRMFDILVKSGSCRSKEKTCENGCMCRGPMPICGAKTDLYVDGACIIVSTSDVCEFKPEEYYNLLCYHAIVRSSRNRKFPIAELGVYFARYGILETFPVPDRRKADMIKLWVDDYVESKKPVHRGHS